MQKTKNRKHFFLFFIFAIMPLTGQCAYVNFLPMEDSMAEARNTPMAADRNIQPYQAPLYFEQPKSTNFFDFSAIDIAAFIFLAGTYFLMTRKSSKTRNAGF